MGALYDDRQPWWETFAYVMRPPLKHLEYLRRIEYIVAKQTLEIYKVLLHRFISRLTIP